jgi:hypothetical protein
MKVLPKHKVPDYYSSKIDELRNVSYPELLAILGEPTYDEASEDDKVQVEWVINVNDEIYTIYDWKTYDRYFTENELTNWSIGGATTMYLEDLKNHVASELVILQS